MKTMTKPNWQSLFLEMLMVMIGVLLALLVDEWREQKQIDEVVKLTETRILSEIYENHERLQVYRQDLRDRFDSLKSWKQTLNPEKGFREQSGFPGIPTVSLNDAAWSRANSSDMTNFLDTDIIEDAHGLYISNKIVMNSSSALLDLIYSPMSWDANQTIVAYNIVEDIFSEAISQVEQSLVDYEKFVAAHAL